ncbi:hypothetical protein AB6802_05755 [Mesorhizobium sp. RCC_202]|uniref:hypothetical protein n=1 Tax=Mesorhizobium sp. RCC_202 TaxID=3239222 RepID=UPI0035238329
MASFYHGSYIRYAIGSLGLTVRSVTKTLRRTLRPTKYSADVFERRADIPRLIRHRDWKGLSAVLEDTATLAERTGDPTPLQKAGQAFERLGDLNRAARFRLAARRMLKGENDSDWSGEIIHGEGLLIDLVEDDPRSLGRVIRHARLAGHAASRASSATIRVEARLVTLMQRTFPNAVIVSAEQKIAGRKFATFEHLASVFARDAKELAASFVPLQADPAMVEAFRERYRAMTDKPLVGLSWGSKSHTKDVPGFSHWADFMARMPAAFVSLQYGPIQGALRRLRKGRQVQLIHDESVDQMVDMDRFAAQIAALDAVVTISNTTAHLAGALGVPSIFVIDDNFQTFWPVNADHTPWYPRGVVLRKNGRAWSSVLDEAEHILVRLLSTHSHSEPAGSSDR